jgi:tetratricopeptide (TPR) repeat protein
MRKIAVRLAKALPLVLALAAAPAIAADFSAQMTEAKKHFEAKRYDEAIRIYSGIIRADTTQHGAYNMRSIAYTQKGQRVQALEDVRRAVQLAPTNATYRFNLGYDYYYGGRFDEALAEFDQAEKLGFKGASLFSYRAAANLQKGLNAEAIVAATEALSRNPKEAFASGIRARAYYRTEKYKEALEDYAAYLLVYTADNLSTAEAGYAYYKLGMSEEALRTARKVVEMEPRLAVNFSGDQALGIYDRDMRRAKVNELLKTAKEAEAAGNWEAAFAAYSATRFWGMGYTREDRESGDLALNGTIESYLKLQPKPELPENARRYVVQARTYIKDKRFEDALKAIDIALTLAPWHPTFYYDKALVSSELKRYQAAIGSMQWYLKLTPNAPDARQVQDKIYEWEAKMK